MYQTEQRKRLLDLFKENNERTLSSVEIVDRFRNLINKSTIYRNLKLLEDEKLIRKSFNDSSKLYEYQLNNECDQHFHLKCIKCGKVIHLHCNEVEGFIDHITYEHNFNISKEMTTIYGVCKECSSLC